MMIQINLLPWREQARKAKKVRFAAMLIGLICCTLFLILLLHLYYHSLIKEQIYRNNYLEQQIKTETNDLEKFKEKKEQQDTIISELYFLTTLRLKSYNTVVVLETLTRIVPDGVTLTKLMRSNNQFKIYGKAASEIQITQFMKNISNSAIFKQPLLNEFTAKENEQINETYFQLLVEQQG